MGPIPGRVVVKTQDSSTTSVAPVDVSTFRALGYKVTW